MTLSVLVVGVSLAEVSDLMAEVHPSCYVVGGLVLVCVGPALHANTAVRLVVCLVIAVL